MTTIEIDADAAMHAHRVKDERIRELENELRYYREALAMIWRILAPFPDLEEPQP